MNKHRSKIVLLVIMALVLVFAVSACGDNGVKYSGIALKDGQVTEFKQSEFSVAALIFVLTDTAGNTSEIKGSISMLSQEDIDLLSQIGTHKVTFTYEGRSCEVTITITSDSAVDPDDPVVTDEITVYFDTNGGTPEVPAKTGKKGQLVINIDELPTVKLEGKRFAGWYRTANYEGGAITGNYTPVTTTTLYARWADLNITVSFDYMASGVYGEQSYSIAVNSTIGNFPSPSREGYKFNGWYSDAACTNAVSTRTVFERDTTLYANWQKLEYSVTYKLGGGRYNNSASDVVQRYLFESPVTPIVPTRDEFVFEYWQTEDGEEYIPSTMPASNLVLTAVWRIANPQTFFATSDNLDGTLTVTGFASAAGATVENIEIPNIIGGKYVTAIGKGAFKSNTKLVSVSIAEGITHIYDEAFARCTSLNSLLCSFPQSLEYIGASAFPTGAANWQYETKTFEKSGREYSVSGYISDIMVSGAASHRYLAPGTVSISAGAYRGLTSLKRIELPASLRGIGSGAFADSGLETLEWESGLDIKDIASDAFNNTTWFNNYSDNGGLVIIGNLLYYSKIVTSGTAGRNVIIPASVKYIGNAGFSSRTRTVTFENESNIEYIAGGAFSGTEWVSGKDYVVVNGILTYVSYKTGQSVYTVPSTVTAIGANAFDQLKGRGVTNIVLPESVTRIEAGAFTGIGNIKITIKAVSPPEVDLSAFYNKTYANLPDAALAFNPEMKIFVEAKAYASYTSSDSPWYVLSQDGNDMIARLEMQEITKVYGLKDVYELAEQLPDTFTADYKTSDGIQYYGISIPKSAVSTSPGESFITTSVTPEGQPRSMKIRYRLFQDDSYVEYVHQYSVIKKLVDFQISKPTGTDTYEEAEYLSFAIGDGFDAKYLTDTGIKLTLRYATEYTTNADGEIQWNITEQTVIDTVIDGQINPDIIVENLNTSKVVDYVPDGADNTYMRIVYLGAVKEIPYQVSEKQVISIEGVDYFPDNNGAFVYTEYRPVNEGETATFVLPYVYTEDSNGAFVIAYEYSVSATGAYFAPAVEAAEGAYIFAEGSNSFVAYDESLHSGMQRYDMDMQKIQKYADQAANEGLRFNRTQGNGYVAYNPDTLLDDPRYSRSFADEFVAVEGGEVPDGKLFVIKENPEDYYEAYNPDEEYHSVLDRYGKNDFSFDSVNVFGVGDKLDEENIRIKIELKAEGTISSEILYMELSRLKVEGFDTSVPGENKTATVIYGEETEKVVTFLYTVEAKTSEYNFVFSEEGGKALITGLAAEHPATIYIPSELNGLPVKGIADGAFAGNDAIEKVYIGNIEYLGADAFAESSVRYVEFASGSALSEISEGAFRNTLALEEVNMSASSISVIGNEAFAGSGIAAVSLPSSVTRVGDKAFSGCAKLATFDAGNVAAAWRIGANAFENCTLLETLAFGTALTEIGNNAFIKCISLETVELPASLGTISAYMFKECSSLVTVNAPGVTKVASAAFINCPKLTSVTLGRVVSIGTSAFEAAGIDAASFTVTADLSAITTIGNKAFAYVANLNVFDLTASSLLTYIGDEAFTETALTNIYIPVGVTYLGTAAFSNIETAQSLTVVSSSVTKIEESAFDNNKNMSSVTLSAGITEIGRNAFRGTAVTSVEGSGVTVLGEGAFARCTGLTSANFPNLVTMGSGVFTECPLLKSYTLAPTVTEIGMYAFSRSGLETIDFNGAAVTNIGMEAFSESNLTAVSVPASVATIGNRAFYRCEKLTSFSIPENNALTSIGEYAFAECISLTNLTLGVSKQGEEYLSTAIAKCAFEGCAALTSLVLPTTVVSIGDGAFKRCTGLVEICIGVTRKNIYRVATKEERLDSANTLYVRLNDAFVQYDVNNPEHVAVAATQYVIVSGYVAMDGVLIVDGEQKGMYQGRKSQLTTIGNEAFAKTNSLKRLYITAESPKTFGSGETNANNRQFGYYEYKLEPGEDGSQTVVETFISHFSNTDFELHILDEQAHRDAYSGWAGTNRQTRDIVTVYYPA